MSEKPFVGKCDLKTMIKVTSFVLQINEFQKHPSFLEAQKHGVTLPEWMEQITEYMIEMIKGENE